MWKKGSRSAAPHDQFLEQFKLIFDHNPKEVQEASKQLKTLVYSSNCHVGIIMLFLTNSLIY